ncbi:spondin domain-containing protein [Salinigranum halophilum]|uniref:spondin domain-containing protein n=1 Tax=Salinigranum halophilum TaxID=2565931 RepID=UPI0010A7CC79|nr:spondin domain-containing protein [Salinigranum halophilum]
MTSDSRLPTSRRAFLAATGATVGGLALGGTALAQQDGGNGSTGNAARTYRVTVTNLTPYQPFTPPAIALHRPSVEVFSVGDPASTAVQEIAENGNLDPLLDVVSSTNAIRGAAVGDGPLVPASDPGDTGLPYVAELEVGADASARYLSFVSMLVATNDGFVGLDTVPLPQEVNGSLTYFAQGYDAGTETNTEQFADLVPPAQALTGENREGIDGTGTSDPALAEDGVITPHPGITGIGDVPEAFDWPEPAASVVVERIS